MSCGKLPQLLSLSKRKTGTQSGEDWLSAITAMPHIIVFCFIVLQRYFIFYKLKICGNPASGKPISAVSNSVCSLCVAVSHFGNTIFQTVSWSLKVKVKSLSHVRLFVILWAVAYHAPPSMGFSRQEYLSGLPFPPPEDLPNPGIEPGSPEFWEDALQSEPPGKSHDPSLMVIYSHWSLMLLLQKYFDLLKIQMMVSIY